jgi:hypothetical protein
VVIAFIDYPIDEVAEIELNYSGKTHRNWTIGDAENFKISILELLISAEFSIIQHYKLMMQILSRLKR